MADTVEEKYNVNLLHTNLNEPSEIMNGGRYLRISIRPYDIALVLAGRCRRTDDSSERGDPPSPVQGLPPFFVDDALCAVHETQVRVLLMAQPIMRISPHAEAP